MKKRNCRKTDVEREQHDRAIRVRKMTDAQLCDYLDGLGVTRAEPQPSKEEIITAFLEAITIRRDDGLRVSDATVKKITVRVASQTAYHIRETAERLGVKEGEVVDILVQAMQKGGGIPASAGRRPRKDHVERR